MLSMRISAVLFAGALAAGNAVAAPAASPSPPQTKASAPRQAPLPPGPAAPIREAQGVGRPLLYWAAAGVVIIAGVLLIYDSPDDTTTTTATTSTGN